ncbi:hypothetical protein Caci_6750 [Catenulispora acidiphila DSM 44928]|uniref:Uncharacterized protein n=1 Tax=Catenulispora acidiphila (strain DSM 44928 / JCM 14897 / NBRC 102108 / NRRL B-24433 / ID139908) TaxID=479433 RepID=C7Q1P4_CATAD|nr:hypothetical protein Caci_6750 [Catenulispora acidiphila DSM 44928]
MSLPSVLATLVAVLVLANIVLVLRLTDRCADHRQERVGEGASSAAAQPSPVRSEPGTVAPERRT